MELNIEFDLTLTDADAELLAQILGCDQNALENEFRPYATSAATELVSMILGKRVFTRGSDILQHRLLLLIEHVFEGRIPNERVVSSLFQVSSSGAGSLLRAVMSKYQYQIRERVRQTMIACLESAEELEEGEGYSVVIQNRSIVEELNNEVARIDGTLSPVTKERGHVSKYALKSSTYDALCGEFGI